MDLVIVESPSKAKTIAKYLGKGYTVDASGGHIRDLPETKTGIDFKNNFQPTYVVIDKKKADIKRLQDKCKKAGKIYLATDPDREGEAISWHLAEVLHLNLDDKNRIEFNEISEKAVKEALKNPRSININLVDAQQARRVLDRIVGYKVSPIATRRLSTQLSAGRVQSVALKLIVDREREIKDFKPVESWNIKALLENKEGAKFKGLLSEYNGKKYKPKNAQEKDDVLAKIENKPFYVKDLKKSIAKSHAPAPFTTSTMQQDAVAKMNMTSSQIMQLAQHLYEGIETPNGHIAFVTYIRTDSVRVSNDAQAKALEYIKDNYGKDYVPNKPNVYKTKKGAQDAHEAIRPIDITKTPEVAKKMLDVNHYKLYKLIYERFIASQMAEAKYNTVQLETECEGYVFKTGGKTLLFKGYTAVYDDTAKDVVVDEENSQPILPPLTVGEMLKANEITSEQKFSKPPVRYTDSTIVKLMEEKGIGRPSTYATIVGLLAKRKYTAKDGKYIVPTPIAYTLVDFLVKYFTNIMDVKFTASMEDKLDEIGDGGKDWHNLIRDFYVPFETQLQNAIVTDVICEKCGAPMLIKSGVYGDYYACSNYPNCTNIKSVKENVVIPTDMICEKCGSMMVEREGKNGKFLACSGWPKCRNTKSIAEEVVKKVEEKCEYCGGEMIAKNGRFGEYYQCTTCGKTKSKAEIIGKCPKCGRPTKKMIAKTGKVFYGCTAYPECDFYSWDVPTGESCPKCGECLVKIKDKVVCSNKKCDYTK